jgi:CBS domain-containing protein
MRAKDIMSAPVVTIRKDADLKDCARTLADSGFNALPVVSDSNVLVGIVSESDLVACEAVAPPAARAIALPNERAVAPRTVGDVMTREVVSLPPDAEVSRLAWIMADRHLKTIPIVEDGTVVGIVSRRDLLHVLCRPDEDVRAEVLATLDMEPSLAGAFNAVVTDGHVALFAGAETRNERRLAEIVVRRVPGVLSVAFYDPALPRGRLRSAVGPKDPRISALP